MTRASDAMLRLLDVATLMLVVTTMRVRTEADRQWRDACAAELRRRNPLDIEFVRGRGPVTP